MVGSIDKEFLEIFIDETLEYINEMEYLISKLQEQPNNKEIINKLFRILHSLKGNAATIGLDKLAHVSHKAEDLLDLIRRNQIRVTKDTITLLYKVLDYISKAVNELSAGKSISSPEEVLLEIEQVIKQATNFSEDKGENINRNIDDEKALQKEGLLESNDVKKMQQSTQKYQQGSIINNIDIKELNEDITDSASCLGILDFTESEKIKLAEAINKGLSIYCIILKFRDPTFITFRYFQALQRLGEVGDIIKSIPSGSDVLRMKTDTISIIIGIKKLNDLKDAIREINDLVDHKIMRISINDLNIDLNKVSIDIEGDRLSALENIIKKIEEYGEEHKSLTEPEPTKLKKLQEVRINVRSLDTLFNLVGELVLIKSRLLSLASQYDIQSLKEALTTFERLVNELQNEIMLMRLVPLHYLFRRIPRFANELSEKYGKQLDIYYEGGEIALDRKVLEELSEPLFKIIEILVKDDIEKPDVRVMKGKPSVGTIRIYAYREGNRVIITVESDGKGLDSEEVAKRAVELGLVPPSSIGKLTDEEKLMLATLPGFSLRNNEFAGLDKIKHSIESIGGTIEIYSKTDHETKITFKIPVSMATLRALLIKLKDQIYAIPVSSIITTMKLNVLNSAGNINVIKYQSKFVSVHDLARILEIENKRKNKNYIVLIEKRGKYIGLLVDEILGQEDIVVKPLSKLLSKIKGFSGATILGDGKVCLILDPISLL